MFDINCKTVYYLCRDLWRREVDPVQVSYWRSNN